MCDRRFRRTVTCRFKLQVSRPAGLSVVIVVGGAAAFLLCAAASAEPASSETKVSFRAEIAPLLRRRCLTCHDEDSAKGGYQLANFEKLLQPGESELAPIIPGKSSESELMHLLREPDASDRMPQKADALPAEEIELIARWIDQGAINDGGPSNLSLVELTRETFLRSAPVQYARPCPITALAFNPEGTQIAVSGYFEVTVWDLVTGTLARRIGGLPERITSLDWDRTSNLLVAGGGVPSQWGTVAIVDPAAEYRVQLLCDLPEVVTSVAVADGKPIIAAAGGDRTVRFFELRSGKETRVLRQHADWVQAVALSKDGNHAATGSRDRTVKVFDTRTGELESTYTGHETPIVDVGFSLSGASVFSMAHDRTLHRWNRQSAAKDGEFFVFPSDVLRIAVTQDRIVTAGSDDLVRVSQISDRQLLFALPGHRDVVQAIAISPGGNTFATGSYDGEVCVWETVCGTWLQRFVASPMAPSGAAVAGAATVVPPDSGP
jgi:hypothetical protein